VGNVPEGVDVEEDALRGACPLSWSTPLMGRPDSTSRRRARPVRSNPEQHLYREKDIYLQACNSS
jgi:hypothetical protein